MYCVLTITTLNIKNIGHCMSKKSRDILIAQLTNLKNLNKKTVSLDVEFVLNALTETTDLPKPKPIRQQKMSADAGKFKD